MPPFALTERQERALGLCRGLRAVEQLASGALLCLDTQPENDSPAGPFVLTRNGEIEPLDYHYRQRMVATAQDEPWPRRVYAEVVSVDSVTEEKIQLTAREYGDEATFFVFASGETARSLANHVEPGLVFPMFGYWRASRDGGSVRILKLQHFTLELWQMRKDHVDLTLLSDVQLGEAYRAFIPLVSDRSLPPEVPQRITLAYDADRARRLLRDANGHALRRYLLLRLRHAQRCYPGEIAKMFRQGDDLTVAAAHAVMVQLQVWTDPASVPPGVMSDYPELTSSEDAA